MRPRTQGTRRQARSAITVEDLRARIDAVDGALVRLLNQRIRLASRIGRLKAGSRSEVYVPAREKEVLSRVKRLNRGPISDVALQAVYREIMSGSLARESPVRVAYLGPPATCVHEAALGRFGNSVAYVPCGTVKAVFDAVETGAANYGVAPTADSVDGAGAWTAICFLQSPLKICAEIWAPVSHHLISRGASAGIRRIYGHPRALSQCQHWLNNRLPDAERVPAASTARAAEQAGEEKGAGAIGGELAAKLHGLTIRSSAIGSGFAEAARFLVVSRKHGKPSGDDKTSILFTAGSEPGNLCRILEAFKRYRVNVVGVESLADRENAGRIHLWLDVTGHEADGQVSKALARAFTVCGSARVLGSYPNAR